MRLIRQSIRELALMRVLNAFALEFFQQFPQERRPANRASDEGDRRQQQEEKE